MHSNAFHHNLEQFINFKGKYPFEIFSFYFLKNAFYKNTSSKISSEYKKLSGTSVAENSKPISHMVHPYAGNNLHVIRMKNYLESHLKDDLIDAMVHGSLGNYDEMSYSDFDALVIIKNEVLANPARLARVARKLNDARRIMHEMDILQHHGWFVLPEFSLDYFDETYFPSVLFNYSKSMLHEKGVTIQIRSKQNQNYKENFYALTSVLIKSLKNKNKIKNMYLLKSVLSRFMLLPALFYALKYQKGIFKKESFTEVKKEFSNTEWQIMNDVSEIRRCWNSHGTGLAKQIILNNYFLHHKLLSPFFPSLDSALQKKINEGLFNRMIIFVEMMQSKVKVL